MYYLRPHAPIRHCRLDYINTKLNKDILKFIEGGSVENNVFRYCWQVHFFFLGACFSVADSVSLQQARKPGDLTMGLFVLNAIFNSVDTVNKESNREPDQEPRPCNRCQCHHHVGVDQHAQEGKERHKRHLKRLDFLYLRLEPNQTPE